MELVETMLNFMFSLPESMMNIINTLNVHVWFLPKDWTVLTALTGGGLLAILNIKILQLFL